MNPRSGVDGGRRRGEDAGTSFAAAVEPIELLEGRRELVREVQWWLTEWEGSRDPEARGRLLQSLRVLALLVGGRA